MMKKTLPFLLAALLAGITLVGCAEEKDQPIKDGKTPEHQQASKKADEGG